MSDGPKTLHDWIQYLHAASQAHQANPDDLEAQDAIDFALQRIQRLQTAATAGDQPAEPGAVGSTVAALAHGASLGTGELAAGVGGAVSGKGFRQGAQDYREALNEIEAAHPNLAAGGELAGMLALPAGTIGRTVAGGVKAGVPLGIRGAASIIGRGAVQGAVPGAIQGFSTGGEDPGDLGARAREGVRGGVIGGLMGGAIAGVGIPLARRHVEREADLADRGAKRTLTQERIQTERARQAALNRSANRGAAPVPPGVTAEEVAVAKQLGIPVEQVRGRVGANALRAPEPMMRPTPKAPPDPLDVPTYLRRREARAATVPAPQVLQRALEPENPWTSRSPVVRARKAATPPASGQVAMAQRQIELLREALSDPARSEGAKAFIDGLDPQIAAGVREVLGLAPKRQ